ncbi:MAG: hypothetical protein V7708_17375 [Oceanicoccus sp.]
MIDDESLDELVVFFELDSKYQDNLKLRQAGLKLSLRNVFEKQHPRNVEFESRRFTPSELTEGMATVTKMLHTMKKQLSNLKTEEERWALGHIEMMLPFIQEGGVESDPEFKNSYLSEVGLHFTLENTIDDYLLFSEDNLTGMKEKNTKSRYVSGAMPKTLLVSSLITYWKHYAHEPGKMTVGGGPSRFKRYIELSFGIAGEKMPAVATLNKYISRYK